MIFLGPAVLKSLAGARIKKKGPTPYFKNIKNKMRGGDICAPRAKHGIAPNF